MAVNIQRYISDIRSLKSEAESEKAKVKRQISGGRYSYLTGKDKADLRNLNRIDKKADELYKLLDREQSKILDKNQFRQNTETRELEKIKNEVYAISMGIYNFKVMEDLF